MKSVAIIGGGLTGLATAVSLRLVAPTIEVTVFESGNRTGGVIHTESVDGFLIDHGADMFATKPGDALELCRRLGVENKLILPQSDRRGARIVRHGKLVPIPDGFVLMRATKLLPMLTTPLLSPLGKLRFLCERFVGSSEEVGRDDFDESIEAFVRRRMGHEVLDRIVAPLSAGIYTADITKLSMRATMGPIAEMERQFGSLARATAARRRSGEDNVERGSTGARYGQFRAFAGGMIELIRSLTDALPQTSVRLNLPIKNLVPENDRWNVVTQAGERLTFDHVVVATPPRVAAKLVETVAPFAAEQLAMIESASTAIVVMGVRDRDIQRDINTFGFVVPLSENRKILAGSFASHKFAGRAPDGHTLVRVFVGGAMQPELLDQGDDEIVAMVRQELAELIGLTGEPIVTRVVRWNHAMPQYHVGHNERVKQIRESIESVPGLSVINNGLGGVGIAPVIRAADKLALSIAKK
ncbi:Protoporphyrinogen oxidase [Rubripirellula tenax]|uniref:Coproporphyrinogen III oxidase n=1 Tax=Rubripirellula tenax TaxID=2528015 RepID=A0A5C6FE55_9BACT|nr:protoporphyrinogen oxidase [Rubripirellula tenax]TWU59771.1 Protoporphyrinogen oxidase [Rubripirellula tenax]